MEKTTGQKIVGRWLVFAGSEGRLNFFENNFEKPLDRCLRVCYNGIANKKNHSDNWNSLSVDRGYVYIKKLLERKEAIYAWKSLMRKQVDRQKIIQIRNGSKI